MLVLEIILDLGSEDGIVGIDGTGGIAGIVGTDGTTGAEDGITSVMHRGTITEHGVLAQGPL